MAVGQVGTIEHKLIAHGRSPVALVENGTRPEQRVAIGRLGGMKSLRDEHDIRPPAMLFVGEVAALAARLGWYGEEVLTESAPLMPAAATA